MSRTHLPRAIPAALAAGLAWGLVATASARTSSSGSGLPSGSGSGTGTGPSSGSVLNPPGSRTPAGVPRQPSSLPTLPLESLRGPSAGQPIENLDLSESQLSEIDAQLLDRARQIAQPGERALAMERIARSKIFGLKLAEADAALAEAAKAALDEPDQVVRDRRILGIVATLLGLAESQLREGITGEDPAQEMPDGEGERSPDRPIDRATQDPSAESTWERAADLASRITNPDYRGELMFRVADAQAQGALTIASEFPSGEDEGDDEKGRATKDAADRSFARAAAHAGRIDRAVWRDGALVFVTAKAASAGRYARGLEIARTVIRPELRTAALIRVAEAQSRAGLHQEATSTYAEAARSVASIALTDPRAILTGVLIDSLIAVGRFDDARASIVLYPDATRQLAALGAVAESQGRRGLADEARAWIDRDAPPEARPLLHRRLTDGLLAAVEQYRTNILAPESAR